MKRYGSLSFGFRSLVWLSLLMAGAIGPAAVRGQGGTASTGTGAASRDEEEAPLVSDSAVGYLDNPLLGNQLRFRYDSSYDNVQPARAELFWPINAAFGPGPGPETSVDYQDLSLYAESMIGANWSAFGELPFRIANPEVQDNTAGLGDSNIGVKYRLHQSSYTAWTAQLRVYFPTGDGGRGLGNDHTSIEPGLLYYDSISDRVTLYAELKDWIALAGTPGFAGNVLRYGFGASYELTCDDACRPLLAVGEVVGWTVLNGGTAISTTPANTLFTDATGDTIVNAKFGLRWRLTALTDIYGGYGRVLTEQTWYDDTVRIELRRSF